MCKDQNLIIGYCLMALNSMGPTSENQRRLFIEKLYTLFDEVTENDARLFYERYLARCLENERKFKNARQR